MTEPTERTSPPAEQSTDGPGKNAEPGTPASQTPISPAQEELSQEQVKDLKFRRRFEVIKYVLAVLGALYVFCRLTAPEHLLNRSVSQENLSREHAKLLLEVLREPDPVAREVSLQIIDKSYPGKDPQWLLPVKKLLNLLKLRDRYANLQVQNRQFMSDFASVRRDWLDPTDPYSAALQHAIQRVDEMRQISREFKSLSVQLPSDDDTSLGCVTMGAIDVTSNSAPLVGAPLGPRDKEWFDFDLTVPMKYSVHNENQAPSKPRDLYSVEPTDVVGVVRGAASGLQPGTTYHFRYVTQHEGITCFGDTITFTTLGR
jgi:hypothetical protein